MEKKGIVAKHSDSQYMPLFLAKTYFGDISSWRLARGTFDRFNSGGFNKDFAVIWG